MMIVRALGRHDTMPNLCSLALILMLAGAASQPGPQAPVMQPGAFDVAPLADGVYAILRRDPADDAANSNVMVIVNDRDVIVVDANLTPASAEATIAAIRKITPLPVRYVINTHWHDDHVLGNGAYADAFPGVEFIGHPVTRTEIAGRVAASLEQNKTAYADELKALEARLAKGVRRDGQPYTEETRASATRLAALYRAFLTQIPRIRITPPTLLVEDSLTIRRGTREIRVLFLGRGNTAGDLVVHLPNESIVASGDLIVHPIPYAFGVYPGDWIETLGRVEALGAAVIMPGHGPVQRDSSYLQSLRQLLESMRTQMRDAVAKGLTLEQARAALELEAFRDRFAGDDPARRAAFTSLFVTPASERAYLEAKGELK